MGRFATNAYPAMDTHQIQGGFQFSAAKIGALGATEYTLTTIAADGSGSVDSFWPQIKAALKEVVRACRRSPRADNLMLRVIVFSDTVTEIHGFRPLPDCNDGDYDSLGLPGGMTALFDATFSAVKATTDYGRHLSAAQFSVNGSLFVITDGADNRSKVTTAMVGDAIGEAKTSEALESIVPVLIGVNTDAGGLNAYLDTFKTEAGFQQYVAIGSATEKELAKLGGFISRSISSQSQALGSGGVSKSLTF